MRPQLRAALRLTRLLRHFARGLWLTGTRHRRAAEAQDEIVRDWLARVPALLGVSVEVRGAPPASGAALWVANHISWLDIPLLGGLAPGVVFLAKAEIRRWPIIGTLATGAGTLYLRRGSGSEAAYQAIVTGLETGRHIAIFPEGTTTPGDRVRRFHPRLFQAVLDHPAPVQPIVIRYRDATSYPARSAAYVDDDSFLGSLWRVLRADTLVAQVHFLPPQTEKTSRDAAALEAETHIRAQLVSAESLPLVSKTS